MKRGLTWALLLAVMSVGCGDDAQNGSDASSTSGSGGGAGGPSTSSGGGNGGENGGGNGGGNGGSGGEAGGGGGSVDPACASLPAGPFEPTLVTDAFEGSEDFAFDGKGRIAAKLGADIVLVDSTGQRTDFASLPGTVYGLRYRPDGVLIAARPGAGVVVQISTTGVVSSLAANLGGPNGVFPDADGNVWVTEFGDDRVIRINPDQSIDTIVEGAPDVSQPNGIFFDATRALLFYTNYGAGEIRRVSMSAGVGAPALVAEIQGAALDGLAMDACGNLYAVDNGGSQLFRVRLDAAGALVGEPELLASFPANVANAQFGAGPGFDPKRLYVAGAPGSVYSVDVGVAGAAVPLPP